MSLLKRILQWFKKISWLKKKKSEDDWDVVPWDNNFLYRDNQKDWDNSTDDKLRIVIEESRLYLQSMLDNNRRLLNKIFFLLTLFVGMIGYIYTNLVTVANYVTKNNYSLHFWRLYFLFLISMYIYIIIKHILPTKDYFFVGKKPTDLLTQKVMSLSSKKMIAELLRDYHFTINHNVERNERTVQNIMKLVVIIFTLLIIGCLFF
jgi:hypothetical protein